MSSHCCIFCGIDPDTTFWFEALFERLNLPIFSSQCCRRDHDHDGNCDVHPSGRRTLHGDVVCSACLEQAMEVAIRERTMRMEVLGQVLDLMSRAAGPVRCDSSAPLDGEAISEMTDLAMGRTAQLEERVRWLEEALDRAKVCSRCGPGARDVIKGECADCRALDGDTETGAH